MTQLVENWGGKVGKRIDLNGEIILFNYFYANTSGIDFDTLYHYINDGKSKRRAI